MDSPEPWGGPTCAPCSYVRSWWLALGPIVCLACGSAAAPDGADDLDEGAIKLGDDEVAVAGTVPLLEVSALGLRDGKLLSIGDRDFRIALDGRIGRDEVEVAASSVRDVSALFPANPRGSQWEGIAADGAGNVFVLEENPGRIFVLDRDARRLLHTITLEVPESSEEWTVAWRDSANSRAEGFVLLKNGHVLIAKEKDPRRIVEFGPKGERASGFRKGGEITTQTFPFSGRESTLVALKAWKIEGKADDFGDISELAVGPDGLYVLSDESRAIAKIPALDVRSDEAVADEKWKLPFKSSDEDKKTEGLVILPGGSNRVALVALDGPKKDNVYRVKLD